MNTRAFSLLLAFICTISSGLLPGLAWSQSDAARPPAGFDSKPIGKVQETAGTVTIEHPGGVVVQANLPAGVGHVKVDDSVYRGDMITTGADGSLGIIFADGTVFKVSSNAHMELNEYVYDPNGASNSTLINLSKGSFTFLAGAIAKTGSMKVATPVGTMGIRGTAPHVEIQEDGSVKFSTLIEENKSATGEQINVPTAAKPQRKAQAPSAADDAASQKAEREFAKRLTICKGC